MKSVIALSVFALLTGCVSRSQVQADIWLNDGLPASVCDRDPELKKYGFYRVVTCKSRAQAPQCANGEASYEEFISYCKPSAKHYLSMHEDDAVKWLGEATKPRK